MIIIFNKIRKKINSSKKTNSSFFIVVKNFSWIFSGKFFYIISNLVVSIIITRSLGPEKNGIFNYVLAFTALFSAISGMGLEEVIVKEFNVENNQKGGILLSGFILKLCGGILACILAIISAYYIGISYEKLIYISIISVSFIFQSFDVFLYWFQSQSHSKVAILCQNSIRIIFIVLKLICAVCHISLLYFIILTSLETIILSVSLFVVYHCNNIKADTLIFKKRIFTKLFRLSWPMILSSVASSVYMKIDQVMIGESLGDYELGIYSVAVRLAESWYFIPMSVAAAVLPFMTRVSERDEKRLYRLLQTYADAMTLMAYVISLGITIFARIIIFLLFGKEYLSADSLLILYVWAGIFVNFGLIRGSFVSVKECTQISLYGTLIGAICNIIFNLWMIPFWGAKGAVWATIITQMIASFLSSFLFKRTRTLAWIELNSLFPFTRLFKFIKTNIYNKENM